MRKLFFISFFALPLFVNAQIKNPATTLKFDKVIMYDFKGEKDTMLNIVSDKGKLNSHITKKIPMRKGTIDALSKKFSDSTSFGGTMMYCFIPHLGFVFYQKDSIVGHITVCMDCNRMRASVNLLNKYNINNITNESFQSDYLPQGFSTDFKKYLSDLLKKNKFSHSGNKL